MADKEGVVDPYTVYRFRVEFVDEESFTGAFSEISGLEATMEPVSIAEGGWNYGERQLVGRTTFGTVIMKRGMSSTRHLVDWFNNINITLGYANRQNVVITVQDAAGKDVIYWTLLDCLPVKLKMADLNSTSQEVGIEELHLVHEGILENWRPGQDQAD